MRLIIVEKPIKAAPIINVKIKNMIEKKAGVLRLFINTKTISSTIPKNERIHKTAAARLKTARILS